LLYAIPEIRRNGDFFRASVIIMKKRIGHNGLFFKEIKRVGKSNTGKAYTDKESACNDAISRARIYGEPMALIDLTV